MNINDQVYIVEQATLHNNTIPNSIAIIPAKIVSMGENNIIVEVPAKQSKYILMSVDETKLYPTIAKALEIVQKELTQKPIENITSKEEEDES